MTDGAADRSAERDDSAESRGNWGKTLVLDPSSGWRAEHELCIKATLFHRYEKTTAVQLPVVVAAQGHQVIQTRFPAISPVLYVVGSRCIALHNSPGSGRFCHAPSGRGQ